MIFHAVRCSFIHIKTKWGILGPRQNIKFFWVLDFLLLEWTMFYCIYLYFSNFFRPKLYAIIFIFQDLLLSECPCVHIKDLSKSIDFVLKRLMENLNKQHMIKKRDLYTVILASTSTCAPEILDLNV